MRTVAIWSVAFLFAVFLGAPRTSAQDMAEMSKWAGAKLIHWHLVGDYSATVPIIEAKWEGGAKVKLTDHLEIDFDWDNMTIVGQPVIKNSPSKYGPPEATCPVTINGTLEYFTLDSINPMAVMLMLQGKQNRPAGSVPKGPPNDNEASHPCGFYGSVNVAATSQPVTMKLQLPQAMMLAMPTPPSEMQFSPDHKSIIQKVNTDGWVWTMTPTVVR